MEHGTPYHSMYAGGRHAGGHNYQHAGRGVDVPQSTTSRRLPKGGFSFKLDAIRGWAVEKRIQAKSAAISTKPAKATALILPAPAYLLPTAYSLHWHSQPSRQNRCCWEAIPSHIMLMVSLPGNQRGQVD